MTQALTGSFTALDAQFYIFTRKLFCAAIAVSLAGPAMPVYAQSAGLGNAETSPFTQSVPQTAPASAPAAVQSDVTAAIAAPLPAESASGAEVVLPKLSSEIAISAPASAASKPLRVIYSYDGAGGNSTKVEMDELRVVHVRTTQNLVAAQVGLNVAMMLLGGGALVNMNFRSFSKDKLRGDPPEDLQDKDRLSNPARTLLLEAVERQSLDWLAANPKTSELQFDKPLVISSASWRLVYNSQSSDDQAYLLRLDVDIFKRRDKAAFFQDPVQVGTSCHFASAPLALSEWKANDYQAVADLRPVAVAQCANEFTAQLPALLELK